MAPLKTAALAEVVSRSSRSTKSWARRFAASLQGGEVLALSGELGAGKTTFVQGLAAGLGVADLRQVVSPTYTLANEYPGGRLLLVHLDFYRLDSAEAARALGLDELLGRPGTVAAVEWPERAAELVPEDAIWIHLSHTPEGGRRLRVCSQPKVASREAL